MGRCFHWRRYRQTHCGEFGVSPHSSASPVETPDTYIHPFVWFCECDQCAAVVEMIVPVNVPDVGTFAKSAKLIRRSTLKLPVAPANAPVPPVIVLISTIVLMPGMFGMALPSPAIVVKSISPFAAVS